VPAKVDILMNFVDSSGKPIAAESQSRFNPNDDFMAGFQRGKFFDVESFDFGVKLHDDADGAGASRGKKEKEEESGTGGTGGTLPKPKKAAFARWLGATGNLKNFGYLVDVDEFGFKRQFDSASPVLFQLCANSTSLKSATLVQRKAGDSTNKMGIAPCYLRIDFDEVLLTSVNWDVEEQGIDEKIKFICRSITVQYRMQMTDGTMAPAVMGGWSFDADVS
jgi:type VI protein secretion system component Hcp